MAEAKIFRRLAEALKSDVWRQIARPNQLPPDGDWSIWLLLAGRGFGKTRAAAEWVRDCIESGAAKNVAIVGATAADVRDTCVEGPSGILAISPDWNRPNYEPSKRRLTWPNGAVASLFSSEEPDRLRGPNHDAAWCDELASWQNQQGTWDNLMLTLRLGARPRVCVSTTPKPTKLLRELVKRAGLDVTITRGSTFENRANLAPSFLKAITERYVGTRLGRQELEAEILEDIEGALWSRDMVDDARIAASAAPSMKRIVVAIDPAVSVGENSDLTGIVVCGFGENGLGYVLADESGRYLPTEWARRAVSLYHKWAADRVIAEQNQGGLMVEETVRAIDRNVAYRGVHAKKGKVTRAEPISALFEQRRVKIAGSFPELEDELCTYAGGGNSPDRLDAMVYALSDLMLGFQVPEITFVAPVIIPGLGSHNPFGAVGANPFGQPAGMAEVYSDKRTEGFSIKC